MTKNKKISKKKLGAIGLATGAAIGVASVVLSNKKTRKKIKRTLEDIKDKGEEIAADLEKKTKPFREEAEKKIAEIHQVKESS